MKKKFDVKSYLEDIGIDYKERQKNIKRDHVGINCVMCGDDPSHHMNISYDGTHAICYRCSYNTYDTIEILQKIINEEGTISFKGCLEVVKEFPFDDGFEIEPEKPLEVMSTSGYRFDRVWDTFLPLDFLCKKYLTNRGFDIDFCEEVGLKLGKDFTFRKKYYEFRNRIIIPIKNSEGRIVNFSGRHIGKNSLRYKNCPNELVVVGAIQTFFGLYESLNIKEEFIVLVEGFLDALKLLQYGIPAVSLFKKKITREQVEVLSEYFSDRIVLLSLDIDAKEVDWLDIENIVGEFFEMKRIRLQGVKDFGDCMEKDIMMFKKVLKGVLK